jgi:DNA-binding CsgD family transcriptional regulator
MATLAEGLEALGGDIHGSLQDVAVPMYILDLRGTIVWLNDAAEELVPGAVGKKFTDVLAPDRIHGARRLFARRMLGQAPFADHTTTINLPGGVRREVDISSVPLRKGHQIVGVYGVIRAQHPVPPPQAAAAAEDAPALTPRQHEVLRLLGTGLTTSQMAELMSLSPETVRNHVKSTLRELNAKSRLEAVLTAYRLGLLNRPDRARD